MYFIKIFFCESLAFNSIEPRKKDIKLLIDSQKCHHRSDTWLFLILSSNLILFNFFIFFFVSFFFVFSLSPCMRGVCFSFIFDKDRISRMNPQVNFLFFLMMFSGMACLGGNLHGELRILHVTKFKIQKYIYLIKLTNTYSIYQTRNRKYILVMHKQA